MRRLNAVAATMLGLLCAVPAWAGDPVKGERLFRAQCATCHSPHPGLNLIGPSLAGVHGRAYGAAPGYRYTGATPDAAVVWDDATLDKYIADPKSVLPHGTRLYAGLRDPAQRADIVAYLQTLP